MAYKRKTRDEYCVECLYPNGMGGVCWEEVTAATTWQEAKSLKRDYLNNDNYALGVRVVKRRVRIGED